MTDLTPKYQKSVMDYITLSLGAIITISLFVIFFSFWLTDLADKDAQSINLSGSMRMQTYHIGLAMQQNDKATAKRYIDQLHNKWNNPLFASIHHREANNEENSSQLTQHFNQAYGYWLSILKPELETLINSDIDIDDVPIALLQQQVKLTNELVNDFQSGAESKIRQLRSFQLIAFFTTMLVGSLIYFQLKNRIERPLKQLTEASKAIGKGDFTQRTHISGSDELGLLGAVFNQMTESLEEIYADLETRVQDRTEELEKNNTTLTFLFNNAKRILQSHETPLEHEAVLEELNQIIDADNIELCLFTEHGAKPYLHTAARCHTPNDCGSKDCHNCLTGEGKLNNHSLQISHRFIVKQNDTQYGVINVHCGHLNQWQRQLLKSTADQIAIALSLSEQKSQEQRLAMLNERTVIARELHDSLAQALSYLQIQVTLLQKTQEKQKYELQQPIIDELKGGLSSAYRQLRELLTTFRLKIDDGGLKAALEHSVSDLSDRSKMHITLDYQLDDIPLSSAEEIHLLQIVREAGQNAIHHSQGSKVSISLKQLSNDAVALKIINDGISIPNTPERMNHYGLAIMKERSRHLGGDIDISPVEEGGTQVVFSFKPQYILEQVETVASH